MNPELTVEDVMPCCVICKRTVEQMLELTGEALVVVPIYKDAHRMDAMGFLFVCKEHSDRILGRLTAIQIGDEDLGPISIQ
jgi:hypothetical protein